MKTGIPLNGINGQKPHIIKNGIRIPCRTENFVPIVAPGLSSSSSGSSLTSKTPVLTLFTTSSSSSSSSPTASEIQTRERVEWRVTSLKCTCQLRLVIDQGDLMTPKPIKSQNHKEESKIVQSDSLRSEIPEWLQEFRENLVDDEIPLHGDSHARGSTVFILIYTDNSFESKACEDLSWNHCTSTPHRSETSGIAERAVRSVKESTSAVLLQSSRNEKWWADSMDCYTYLRNVTDLLSDGKTSCERRFG